MENGFPSMENGFPSMENDFPSMENGFRGMESDFPSMENGFRSRNYNKSSKTVKKSTINPVVLTLSLPVPGALHEAVVV